MASRWSSIGVPLLRAAVLRGPLLLLGACTATIGVPAQPADAGDATSGGSGDDAVPGDVGSGDPGASDPGTGDPTPGDPGAGDPGTGDPTPGDPGAGDPGTGDPGGCQVVVDNPGPAHPDLTPPALVGSIPPELIPADRLTRWYPGILVDTDLNLPLGGDDLPQRTVIHKTVSPGANLQAELNATPEGTVLLLAPGTFTIASTLRLKSRVVLRGAGSGGADRCGTTIALSGNGPVIAMGNAEDGPCYSGSMGTPRRLRSDALRGATTVALTSGAADFQVGDLASIDALDTTEIQQGDCPYFKRVSGRSAVQKVEIQAVDTTANTLTLSSPLHWDYTTAREAEIAVMNGPIIRWAGVEHLRVAGGSKGYLGQYGAGIDMSNAAYCWVKDVQTGGTIDGMHIAMTGAYRSVVRDSYIHHSAVYGYGEDCYGIVIRCGAAENLVENNIVRYMNKPVMFNVSGGGNVVGYNYIDNAWAEGTWQETPVDCHCAFPHLELIEGNWATKVGATITHGNAGYFVYLRNYSSSQFAAPAIWNGATTLDSSIAAMQFDTGDVGMTAVGNVLGAADDGTSPATTGLTTGDAPIYRFGGASDPSQTTFIRHGNWTYLPSGGSVTWDATLSNHTIPVSLYRTTAPPYFGALPWPWAGSDLTPMVGTLPAKARSDSLYSPPEE